MTAPATPEPAPAPAASAAPSAPVQPGTAAPAPAEAKPTLSIRDAIEQRKAALAGGGTAPAGDPAPEPADDPAPGGGEGDPAPAGDPAPGGEADPGAGGDAGEGGAAPAGEAAPIVVALPGRRPGDPDLQIELPADADPEMVEALQRQRNGYMRGEEVRAEKEALAQDRAEREEFVDLVASDPVGFVTQHVPSEIRAETALGMLVDPDVWPTVKEDLLAMLEDENKLAVARAELKSRRLENRDMLRQRTQARTAARTAAQAIQSNLEAIVPEGMGEAQSEAFVKDALRDLAAYQRKTGVQSIEPTMIPVILAPRLLASGLDPTQVAVALARRAAGAQQTRPSGTAPRPVLRPKAPAPGQATTPVTSQTLKDGQARRAAAAAVPGPGKAAPTAAAGPAIPKGSGVKQAIQTMRDRIKGRPST